MPRVCRPLLDEHGNVIGRVQAWEETKLCSACKSRRHTKLCDFALTGKKAGQTCDAPLCDRCATRVGPNRDYCPAHARAAKAGAP